MPSWPESDGTGAEQFPTVDDVDVDVGELALTDDNKLYLRVD